MHNKTSAALSTRTITLAAMLSVIVVVLQIVANLIQPVPGVAITLVLVPVVIGAALLGPAVGAWLGFVFAMTVLLSGAAAAFLPISAFGTVLTVIVKGVCAGLCAGLVFKALEQKNQYLAVICAAIVCPIVNTGIFLIGCRLFFWPTIAQWGRDSGFENPAAFALLGLAGVNFLIELAINIVLAPVILRLVNIGRRMWTGRK